ncbi:DUF4249 domain-containing protein [Zobellia galactanivorans]|uniref:Putative membrane lipoprotein n=1 Tax=Zobellia galactanivorans (strain DSM 12802 / CCUG 47099 / CIP 106680 / NCIMB 13871 / Dsij) TaxID=63186 RepID=G0L6U0_ZOBGA|nr:MULTISPECIES: DUF4249 domain-containing protein [Zobellia]MBU3025787.1 DUF4249 domain-containing protein [Zobellia galactanivorans]MDO6808977.1 DUF4249 domain-containing protein [Zobellia galactanivorans]OWW25952.1 hypothetical protein B4Q04_10235 [Zobellia sp. OII3]CAZ98635.1 Putative membrane lipoprotein [Zobellia galactanivorans]
MKKHIKIISLLSLAVLAFSCTDVIDVDVQSAPTRLTVEASLDWEKGTLGNEQTIRLSTSTAFFDTTSNTEVTGAFVKVTNDSSGTEFIFEDQNDGTYTTSVFEPIVGQSYSLEIIYNGETYSAQETLNAVPDLTVMGQSRDNGFSEDDLEVNMVFKDPEEEGNSYFFKFQEQGELLPVFEEFDDEFVNGNEIDWYYESEEDDDTEETEAFEPGDVLHIEFYAISQAYRSYLQILVNQIGGMGMFDATPVAVKGNCVNLSDPDNYAHGYFRVTQVVKADYTFE